MPEPSDAPRPPVPNPEFAAPAPAERLERAAERLRAHGIEVVIVENGAAAKAEVLRRVPAGSEVFNSTSRTLETIGLADEIEKSGRFDSARARMKDKEHKSKESRAPSAIPEYMVGSVHAVTEQGEVLVASATGSQLGGYAAGATHVLWVVGAQKFVTDLDEGLRRIREYAYPMEDARARRVYGNPSAISKVLIVFRELTPGRITMVIVKEALGF